MPSHFMLIPFFGAVMVAAAHHGHQHFHQRQVSQAVVTETVTVPVEVFEYNGVSIPESEVCEGILNGTLHWASNELPPPNCSLYLSASQVSITNSANVASTKSVVSTERSQSSAVSTSKAASMSSQVTEKPSPTTPNSVSPTDTVKLSPSASPSGPRANLTNPNVEVEFPDGEVDCSTFPSAYGPVEVAWVGHNGWTGIQYAEFSEDAISGLSTGIAGNECAESEGSAITFCSYACPPGFQKSQWPSLQGNASMAVSVGGLNCSNGKLWLTNPSLSTRLCIEGSGKAFVSNKLDSNAAICRTDYPGMVPACVDAEVAKALAGTEDETVPLDTSSGGTYPLTCPDSSTYYQHLGAQTSAEYYVNNKGISVDQACQWDQDGSDEGNWAPVVIGAETDSNGATWLSIMTSRQNNPTNYKELDYSIELEGDFGGAACFYTQHNDIGYYCSSGNLATFFADQAGCLHFDPADQVTVPGCTVQLFSGTATYHLVETSR